MPHTALPTPAAAATFADAQLGLLLDEMEQLGVLNSTVILLFGDHGWSRGENNEVRREEAALGAPILLDF